MSIDGISNQPFFHRILILFRKKLITILPKTVLLSLIHNRCKTFVLITLIFLEIQSHGGNAKTNQQHCCPSSTNHIEATSLNTTQGRKRDGLSAVKDCVLLYTNIDTITNKMHELQLKSLKPMHKLKQWLKFIKKLLLSIIYQRIKHKKFLTVL